MFICFPQLAFVFHTGLKHFSNKGISFTADDVSSVGQLVLHVSGICRKDHFCP